MLEMPNAIMEEARWFTWDGARRSRATCNPMRPGARLNAYCLMRNLRNSPSHHPWYDKILTDPGFRSKKANDVFNNSVSANSRLVQECVLSFLGVFMAADF